MLKRRLQNFFTQKLALGRDIRTLIEHPTPEEEENFNLYIGAGLSQQKNEAIRESLNHNQRPEIDNILLGAVQTGNNAQAHCALALGADSNSIDADERTALYTTVFNGHHTQIVKALLEKGADVNRCNNQDNTALDYAYHNNVNQEIIDMLENPDQLRQSCSSAMTNIR